VELTIERLVLFVLIVCKSMTLLADAGDVYSEVARPKKAGRAIDPSSANLRLVMKYSGRLLYPGGSQT
jgi:hypothetical protein